MSSPFEIVCPDDKDCAPFARSWSDYVAQSPLILLPENHPSPSQVKTILSDTVTGPAVK